MLVPMIQMVSAKQRILNKEIMMNEWKPFIKDQNFDFDSIPESVDIEDIRYFEDKVKRHPYDEKAKAQLTIIKEYFGVEE